MTDRPMSRLSERWLVALDIDGTVLHEDGTISDADRRRDRAGCATAATR